MDEAGLVLQARRVPGSHRTGIRVSVQRYAARIDCQVASLPAVTAMVMLVFTVLMMTVSSPAADRACADEPPPETAGAPVYPIAVVADGPLLYVVDLDLPGIWQVDASGSRLFARGSRRFGSPLNRPRSVALHPRGGILVGDSATREVYRIASPEATPEPLSGGNIGIAVAMAVCPGGDAVYVGDAETRSVLRLPIDGGTPHPVVAVDARGLACDNEGALWAVTLEDATVQRIDVETQTSTVVIAGRPYRYPNGLTWAGDHGLISDSYGRRIWRFDAAGDTAPWLEGAPLRSPAGLHADEASVWVAEPGQRQVYRIDRASRSPQPLF